MIYFFEKISDKYQELESGLIKAEGMATAHVAREYLKIIVNSYIVDHVTQRAQSGLKNHPELADLVDMDKLAYTLGVPVLSNSTGNYYVPITVYALKKS